MRKKLGLTVCLMMAALFVGVLAGCSGETGAEDPQASVSVKEMADDLVEKIPVATMELDEVSLLDFYGLDSEKYEEAAGYMAMMNVKAADLVIVKAKTLEDVADLRAGLEARQAASEETWSQYLPDQYEIVKNYQLIEKGRYLLYAVAEDAQGIAAIFCTQ